jgi:hypothetical protein
MMSRPSRSLIVLTWLYNCGLSRSESHFSHEF